MKSKIHIMKTKPDLTDDEIRSHMDFEDLIQKAESSIRNKGRSKAIKIVGIAVIIAVTGTFLYYALPLHKASTENSVENQESPEFLENFRLADSLTNLENNKPVPIEKKNELVTPNQPQKEKRPPQNNTQQEEKKRDSTTIRTALPAYAEAEPVNGFPHLYEYFNSELKYPPTAIPDSIQGIVTISFVISRENHPEKIKIINSLGAVFDLEALRLIENMPAWKAATLNGKPVASKISIPLTFRIERIKK